VIVPREFRGARPFMRAFVAIDLPALPDPLPEGLRPENHLTLHFFEELPAVRLPDVIDSMRETAGAIGPFSLEIRGVGAFPNARRARVVWAGVGAGSEEVRTVVDRLRSALGQRGFPAEERPFVPHLTLARVRTPRDAEWAGRFLSAPEYASREWVRAPVSEIVLKESELLPTGARHTVRERVPLRGPSGPSPTR
jgi:RNA 2',3'-cyclic 3'-phosphodiesterase